mmetsp:Transcript_4877/g.10218  ORF Transcript_4877/g.10218 Transcript_4877/m.10218 type:complete len:543 (+) Transcript_4877:19-1647(+)
MAQCDSGNYDCASPYYDGIESCQDYDWAFGSPKNNLFLVVMGSLIMCAMAFGIGGNDVANAWGTSVGSGAIKLRTACIIAGLCDWLGAVTLGYGVSSKITKGVSEVDTQECWACGCSDSFMGVYAVGMLAALIAAATFLLLATFTAMPVSTTHAIVGGVVGVTMMGVGADCLNWNYEGGLGGIVASWIISPLLSGLIGSFVFICTDKLILKSNDPLKRALLSIPFLYALTSLILTYMILIKAGPTKHLSSSVQIGTAFAVAFAVMVVSIAFVVPNVKKNLPSISGDFSSGMTAVESVEGNGTTDDKEHLTLADGTLRETSSGERLMNGGKPIRIKTDVGLIEETAKASDLVNKTIADEEVAMRPGLKDAIFCFRYLLVFNAALESFAHGANDTANSTAAFSAILNSYSNGLYACESKSTPWWIMGIGGLFVLVGINIIGYRVIETIGENVTAINFHRGYCIEFASTATVVIATLLELPVSTTHCQIGAVTFVGLTAFGKDKVEWRLLGQIVLSWIITIPFAAMLSAVLTASFGFVIMSRGRD